MSRQLPTICYSVASLWETGHLAGFRVDVVDHGSLWIVASDEDTMLTETPVPHEISVKLTRPPEGLDYYIALSLRAWRKYWAGTGEKPRLKPLEIKRRFRMA